MAKKNIIVHRTKRLNPVFWDNIRGSNMHAKMILNSCFIYRVSKTAYKNICIWCDENCDDLFFVQSSPDRTYLFFKSEKDLLNFTLRWNNVDPNADD